MRLPIRRLFVSILCLLTSAIVGACSANRPSSATPAEQTSPGSAQSGRISFMVFGDPAELAAYQSLVAAFGAKYPAIQVDVIQVPGQDDYRQRLATDFAAGTPA